MDDRHHFFRRGTIPTIPFSVQGCESGGRLRDTTSFSTVQYTVRVIIRVRNNHDASSDVFDREPIFEAFLHYNRRIIALFTTKHYGMVVAFHPVQTLSSTYEESLRFSTMSSNDDNKAPTETWKERMDRFMATGYAHLHTSVATAVDGLNSGLASAEKATLKIRAPVNQVWQKASDLEQQVEKQMNAVYKRRNEIGPQVIAGSAMAGGLLALLRRRSVFRFVGGSVLAGSLAYVAVYEPIPIKKIPTLIQEQFQPSEKK